MTAWGIARRLYPRGDGPWFAEPGGLSRPAAHAGRSRPPERERLSILRPEDGATFRLVSGALRQGIVCRVAGNPAGSRLWWFVDGKPAGESVGTAPFALDMAEGGHLVS